MLYLSNLIVSKGYLELFDGTREAMRRGANIEVRFWGEFIGRHDDPPSFDLAKSREVLEAQLKAFPECGRLKHCGLVTGQKKVDAFAWADVVVLPDSLHQ